MLTVHQRGIFCFLWFTKKAVAISACYTFEFKIQNPICFSLFFSFTELNICINFSSESGELLVHRGMKSFWL